MHCGLPDRRHKQTFETHARGSTMREEVAFQPLCDAAGYRHLANFKRLTGVLHDWISPTADHWRRLRNLAWVNATLASDATGGKHVILPGQMRPLRPDWRVVGRAFVVQACQDDNLAVNNAVKAPPTPGCVLVVGGHASSRTATIGDLMAHEFRNLGVAAIVTDGLIRDAQELRDLGMPVWCRGTTPTASVKSDPGHVGGSAVVGGIVVRDGDYVFADDDGVVIWPHAELDALVRNAEAKRDTDDGRMIRLRANAPENR